MFMANPRRGNWTPASVPTELQPAWTVKVAGLPAARVADDWRECERPAGAVTAPTIAGEMLFVGLPNTHRIESRSVETGQLLWSFTTGGRVDCPPTLYGGLCLFGSRDGWVYALDAKDGRLAWRFQAAVCPKMIVDAGHLESPWPVLGSVTIHRGRLWVIAGRHSAVDQGIQLYQLDPMMFRLTSCCEEQFFRATHRAPATRRCLST